MPASPMVGELATHRQSDIPQAMRIAILAMIIPMLGGPLPASAAGNWIQTQRRNWKSGSTIYLVLRNQRISAHLLPKRRAFMSAVRIFMNPSPPRNLSR